MKHWFTPAEILAAAGDCLPRNLRVLNRQIEREGWRRDPGKARKRAGRGGGWEYHLSVLPSAVQTRLEIAFGEPKCLRAPANVQADPREALWTRYEALPARQKQICAERLAALDDIDRLVRAGKRRTAAARIVARKRNVSTATLFNWRNQVQGVDRADWLAALTPQWKGQRKRGECDERAWQALKSDYLRPEKPTFAACYRRMTKAAKREGWSPIPSEAALRRRLDAEVPAQVKVLARQGRDAAKTLYPAQKRSRDHFHAMQAVNMDGHRFDVMVRFESGQIGRPHLLAVQDLYSNKIVGWRIAGSENKHAVRLAIGDMVTRHGIPEQIYLDNGRAFASKDISGGVVNRFRFKVKEEEPQGLLTSLGVEIHWTQPYSGQSKPIERAFRDLTDTIARHPACSGAYTGNRPDRKPENYGSRAVPIAVFQALVAQEIAEHNERPGRRNDTAKGSSLDATFAESMEAPETLVRWPAPSQRALWLLASEQISTSRGSGVIEFLGNRYWAEPLNAIAGKKVVVRFDPENLLDDIKVYDLADRHICDAQLRGTPQFDSAEAAQEQNRNRRALLKAAAEQKRLHVLLDPEQLGELYTDTDLARTVARPEPPKVVRLAGSAAAAVAEPEWDEDDSEAFSRALRLVGGTDA